MPDVLEKVETASSQKCTVKGQGQWTQFATEKILTGYKRNEVNGGRNKAQEPDARGAMESPSFQ